MMRYDTTPSPAPWGRDGTQDAPADPKRVAQEMAKLATPAPTVLPACRPDHRGVRRAGLSHVRRDAGMARKEYS